MWRGSTSSFPHSPGNAHTSGFTPTVLAPPSTFATLTHIPNSSHQIHSLQTTIATRNNQELTLFKPVSHIQQNLTGIFVLVLFAGKTPTPTSFPLTKRTFEQLFPLWHQLQIMIGDPDTLDDPCLMFHSFPIAVLVAAPEAPSTFSHWGL